MKKKLSFLLLTLIITGSLSSVFAWGIWGHKHINRAAVFALPEPLRLFFYNHIDFITEESVGPDVRKYDYKCSEEFARHYINMENYGMPIDSLPRTMLAAEVKLKAEQRQKNGILPWYIQVTMDNLTEAFRNKDKTHILFYAASLAHYIGDAHMPLHTSKYHNGRSDEQKGIHAFWEAQLPEQLGSAYNFYTGEARYIENVTDETWRIIIHTHSLADSTLDLEAELSKRFTKDKTYVLDEDSLIKRNKYGEPYHTLEYTLVYDSVLNHMVHRQLRSSIAAVANYWYTAWVNAGKPDVLLLDSKELTEQNQNNYVKELEDWKEGRINYLENEKEF